MQSIMKNELYLYRKDRRVILKLILSFLIIFLPLSSLIETKPNILSFVYFGFFFVSPLIDFSFYIEKIKSRIPYLLGMGYSTQKIIMGKTLVIFLLGLISSLFFMIIPALLDYYGLVSISVPREHYFVIFNIIVYNFLVILLSGLIQFRYEIIFPVRIFNVFAFIFFVNFNSSMQNYYRIINVQIFVPIVMISLIALLIFWSSKLDKDKIC